MCGGQRTTCGSQFSPSVIWVPGIELALSGLAASPLADLLRNAVAPRVCLVGLNPKGPALENELSCWCAAER